jgi:NAD(P)-dependent dehydrogenase (short-subunit alcohol dehydrogenase family)
MVISFDLKNKVVLITGASSGIGQSIAIHVAEAGAKVLLCGRSEERLQETASQCDGRGVVCPQDLSEVDMIPKFVRNLAKEHGPLAGLVHSAGIEKTIPLRALKPKHLHDAFQVNTIAGAMLLKGFSIRSCHTTPSSVVFLSSVAGHRGQPGMAPYSMSKGALEMATKSFALELAQDDIRVNAIAPAMIQTPLMVDYFNRLSEQERENILMKHPHGAGDPEDVASAAIYLLSDASKYVTGTSLLVDGGYCA